MNARTDIEQKKVKGRDCPLFRVSYPALNEPKQYQGKGEAKFSVTMLIPKTDPKVKLLRQKLENAMTESFGPKAKWPKNYHDPFRDGDEEKADEAAYRGMWFVKASAKEDKRPQVLGSDGDVVDPAELYPGCWAKASLIAYAYEYMGKKGMGFALKGIQKVKEGERLDNSDVSSEFDSVSETDGSEEQENYEESDGNGGF